MYSSVSKIKITLGNSFLYVSFQHQQGCQVTEAVHEQPALCRALKNLRLRSERSLLFCASTVQLLNHITLYAVLYVLLGESLSCQKMLVLNF